MEKLGPKEKGVVAQSVKEVIQNLVDDNLVETEKIGTSVYFWAFPSKAANTRKRRLEDLKSKTDDVRKKRKALESKIEEMQVGREESVSSDFNSIQNFTPIKFMQYFAL